MNKNGDFKYIKPNGVFSLFLKSLRSHFLYFFSNPLPILKRQSDRIFAFLLLAGLVYANLILVPIIEIKYHLSREVKEMLVANIHHLQTILLIYFLFGDKIIRFLKSTTYIEKEKFYLDDYYLDLSKSYKEIRILETYLDLLLKNENQFYSFLMDFIKRSKKYNYSSKIQILLLDPESNYSETRIKDIQPHYKDDPQFSGAQSANEFIYLFQQKMIEWLQTLKKLQTQLRLVAEADNIQMVFEIRIYDTLPPFSLYSCDDVGYFGNYSGDKLTTQSRQGIVRNLNNGLAQFQLDRFQEIWNSENIKDKTVPLETYLLNYISRTGRVVEKFKSITKLEDDVEIHKILKELDPDKLEDSDFYSLIRHLEFENKDIKPIHHYNIFGTGGDKQSFKTINISTMASILASHFSKDIAIQKVGTAAVTSLVGSRQFYDCLEIVLRDKDDFKSRHPDLDITLFDYAKDSNYVYLRYQYRNSIRQARQKLFEEGGLDIYKIIFPAANFTGYSAQVNGMSDIQYFRYYEKIYQQFGRSGILMYNDSNTDELMVGMNYLHIYDRGNKVDFIRIEIKITMDEEDYWEFFREAKNKDGGPKVETHVNKFFKLFDQNTHDDIKWTMAYNIALILKLEYLGNKTKTIQELAGEAFDLFFKRGNKK